MRTTIEFDDDAARAVDQLRREGLGVSEAVNTLIRRGLVAPEPVSEFQPIRRELGLRIDVSNVADALEVLEGADGR